MPKLLVTGASGQLGQNVLTHLVETIKIAPADIVAGTRSPEKLADWAAKGIETRKVDFDDPDLAAALAGIDRVLIISTDDVTTPDKRLEQHKKAVAAAKKAGVGHLVYTSMPNPDDSLIPFAPDHLGTEEAIKATGIGYTILRNAWYAENLLQTLPQAVTSGQWFSASGDGRMGYITRDDCARTAATALASSTTDSETYTLTGPDGLTASVIAETLSDVMGKPVAFIPVTDEQAIEGMVGAGMPRPVAEFVSTFDANTRAGKIDIVTNDVETLTGKAPMDIRAFFEANKAALTA